MPRMRTHTPSSMSDDEWLSRKPGSRKQRGHPRGHPRGRPTGRGANPNVAVYQHTLALCQSVPRCSPPGVLCRFDDFNDVVPPAARHAVPYTVANVDTLAMAQQFVGQWLTPLVLNMASAFRPGGGVAKGATAQEEDLFRRTTACLTHAEAWYPLQDDEFIYSPQVRVLKDEAGRELEADQQTCLAMVSVAAIRHPRVTHAGTYKHDDDRALMRRKIEHIFKVAVRHGHDALVLGALGCGAYKNPVDEVCALFQDVCAQWAGAPFRAIGFAVLVKKPADAANLEAFQRAFGAVQPDGA